MARVYMKGTTQFWILFLCSAAICLSNIKEIFLSRSIINQQHILVDAHETASTDAVYKNAWEKLALVAWKAGRQDPAMVDLLKSENIIVHVGTPGPAGASTNVAPAASPLMTPPQAGSPASL